MGMRFIEDPAVIANAVDGSSYGGVYVNKGTFIQFVATQTYPFTIGCWFKLERDIRNANLPRNIFTLIDSGLTTWYSIQYDKYSGGIGSETSAPSSNFYKTLDFGAWHHVCLSATSATNRIIYLDGARIATQTTSFPFTNISDIYVGVDTTSTWLTEGIQIADLSVYDTAQTAAQVHAMANGEKVALKALRSMNSMEHPLNRNPISGAWAEWTIGGIVNSYHARAQNSYDYPINTRTNLTFRGIAGRRRLFVVS